jgi:hypothetical protein
MAEMNIDKKILRWLKTRLELGLLHRNYRDSFDYDFIIAIIKEQLW